MAISQGSTQPGFGSESAKRGAVRFSRVVSATRFRRRPVAPRGIDIWRRCCSLSAWWSHAGEDLPVSGVMRPRGRA